MKIRQARKILNYYHRFSGSKYWLWRWGYYHAKKEMGKIAGDHRIIKAIRLYNKQLNNRLKKSPIYFFDGNKPFFVNEETFKKEFLKIKTRNGIVIIKSKQV